MPEGHYPHGLFCWADMATTDIAAAKSFYATLFGWTFTDNAVAPDMVYSIISVDGGAVGGLYPQPAAMQAAGIPPAWTPYISVDNLHGVVALVPAQGGSVVAPPCEVPDTGLMAAIADPQGAMVNLWSRDSAFTGAAHQGPKPGTVSWNELSTSDLDAAATFYSALFGWAIKQVPGPEPVAECIYVQFMLEGEPVGGLLPLSVSCPDVPPHWLVYFNVADCDDAVATATAHGGRTLKEPFDVPDVGRIAVLADPQGAAFAVIALEMAN